MRQISIEPGGAEEVISMSYYFARLEDATLRAGHNVETLRELCWLLNVHPALPGFVQVCRHLREILSYPDELTQLGSSLISRNAWQPLLRWIVEQGVVLGREIFPGADLADHANQRKFLSTTPRNPIIQSNITRYGLYGALWSSHPLVQLQKPFRLLQGKVLVAHATVMQHGLSVRLDGRQRAFSGLLYGVIPPFVIGTALCDRWTGVECCARSTEFSSGYGSRADAYQIPSSFSR